MKTIAIGAAGDTHPGLHREVNEDRFHVDPGRGLFMVVDGVGGQAAGGKAADVAIGMLRARLERETGTVADRVREAITAANNEIRRLSGLRAEWRGMACVLTVAVVADGRVVVGHVGDTRLYKIGAGRIDKITRDHSPVGEREDAHELSEFEAMRHPRRNEVYRDVGSEPHQPADADFIDVHELPFEDDAALVLCSDGLTDSIESARIRDIVLQCAGRPDDVVAELIRAANDAGGRDNVTAVYVEGDRFAAAVREARDAGVDERPSRRRTTVRLAIVLLIGAVLGYAVYRDWLPAAILPPGTSALAPRPATSITVMPPGSIAAALASAVPGTSIVVQPGEYRERVVLKEGVRVVSQVPRGATIRLPSMASEGDPAVVAAGVAGAEFVGFRIVGDSATPLGTGIAVQNADVAVIDVDISGAAAVAIDVGAAARVTLLGSDIHDNPGAALAVRDGGAARVSHNVFSRNGLSERVGAALIVEHEAQPQFVRNVFQGIGAQVLKGLGDAAFARANRDNWFVDGEAAPPAAAPPAAAPHGRRGR